MGFLAHAQTVNTRPLLPPTTWPGYKAMSLWTNTLPERTAFAACPNTPISSLFFPLCKTCMCTDLALFQGYTDLQL